MTHPSATARSGSLAHEPFDDRSWAELLEIRGGTSCSSSLADDAMAAIYLPIARRTGRPFVVAQVGQSLDGRVATVAGDARELSGPDGFCHLHRLRALADAVVVGVGCVVADDPRLTVRNVRGPHPVRVVLDPNGRIPTDSRILDGEVRTILFQADDRAIQPNVETVALPRNREGLLDPASVVDELHTRGLSTVLLEGGPTTIGHFIDARLVDRLHVSVAPLLIGSGVSGLSLSPISKLSQGLRPSVTVHNLGSDFLFDCDLRNAR